MNFVLAHKMHITDNNNSNSNQNHQESRTDPTSSDTGVNCVNSVINPTSWHGENSIQNINLSTKNGGKVSATVIKAQTNADNNATNSQQSIVEIANNVNSCKNSIIIDNHQNENVQQVHQDHTKINIENCMSENDVNSQNQNDNEDKSSSKSVSVHSNRISIVSLVDDLDSSVVDSDDDYDDHNAIPIGNNNDYIIRKFGEHHNPDVKNDGVIVINQKFDGLPSEISTADQCNGASGSKPQIGSIAVQNSTDITFGNKTFYQGPVTIKQFVVEKKKDEAVAPTTPSTKENGKNNLAFEDDSNLETDQRNNSRYGFNGRPSRHYLNTKAAILTAVILVVVVIGALVFTVQAFLNKSSYRNPDGTVLRFVTRDEWIAQPPMHELHDLELPAFRVIIAHTATEGCSSQAQCTFRVRFIQTFHIESRNFDDIGYHFLVGGDGAVYEGRGWNKEGAHTKGYNKGSICVAFIGTFISIEPPEKQLRAAKLIIEEGVRLGKLKPDYKLYGHRQLIPSESPGEALYKIIQTWSHWTNEI